jgi:hypothetical protein
MIAQQCNPDTPQSLPNELEKSGYSHIHIRQGVSQVFCGAIEKARAPFPIDETSH